MKFIFNGFILTIVVFILFNLRFTAFASEKVIVLNSTLALFNPSLEVLSAQELGYIVDKVENETWIGMTTEDFAQYKAIIIGDNECRDGAFWLDTAEANKNVWGKAVNGNVVVVGTDPAFHYYHNRGAREASRKLIKNSIDFATSASGKTGAYIGLGCYFATSPRGTKVSFLDGIANEGFTVIGGWWDDIHIVNPYHPVLEGISNAELSRWGYSVHEVFESWPKDFEVLAIARDLLSDYIAPDRTRGSPYILARGASVGPPTAPVPFLDLPWDYEGEGLTFNEAALSINSYFDHEYPLLGSGLREPNEALDLIVNFKGFPRIKKSYSSHDGYDYGRLAKVNIGDPVLAAADGIATFSDSCKTCGNMILIDHGNGYQSRYLHLQKNGLITNVPGEKIEVKSGQQIGLVGATGNVRPPSDKGAHIHFAVIQDKNNDGNFSDNIPDGATDPFGWQSKEEDPWPNFVFDYAGQRRTGNTSFYLWKKKLDKLDAMLTSNQAVFNVGKFKIEFQDGSTTQEIKIEIQSSPIVKFLDDLSSLGTTIVITAFDLLGNIVTSFDKPFTLTVDFGSLDISSFDENTISIYSSSDGIKWTKELTIVDFETKTASAKLNHLSYFALMAERLDITPPATSVVLENKVLTLNSQDNEGGLGIDYTLYRIDDGDWEIYKDPLTFLDDGHYKIEFYSADKDGNVEETRSFEFEIASDDIEENLPEAKIFVDINRNDLVIEGIGKDLTVEKTENTKTEKEERYYYIIKDLSGNSLILDVRDRDGRKEDGFRIYSLQYNEKPLIILPSNNYYVTYKKNNDILHVDEQKFEIEQEIDIRMKYDFKRNHSTIVTRENGEEKVKDIKEDLVLLQIFTDKGKLKYNY